jgi:di/tricarboxylate transporter
VAHYAGGLGLLPLQIILAVIASLAALAMGQVGATVLTVPIAINIALAIKADPTVFALIVSLGASNNFLSASNPVIAMIQGPGGYQKRDLVRVGVPLSIVFVVVSVAMVNAIF